LASLFGIVGVFILTYEIGLRGAALGMLGVELYVATAFAIVVQRRRSVLSLFFKPS
jgi:Na+-driven multidrug efflux pump